MRREILTEAGDYLAKKRRHQTWLKVVSALACVVVFCTTYALILPALSLEKNGPVLDCNLKVHQHTGACYDSAGNLVCGYADFVVHTHDENCYDENGVLVCTLPEISQHIHGDACYAPAQEIVLEEGHTHTDACYAEEEVLICELPESEGHVHDESCYDENGELVCGLEETEGHRHSEACYELRRTLICGKEEQPAKTELAEPELICGQQQVELHRHTDACYEGGVLVCGKLETHEHQHTEACFRTEEGTEEELPPCGIPAHAHDKNCYDDSGELICGMEEHIHSVACYADKTADVETQADWEETLKDIELTGEWAQDVLAVAESQLGYTESASNYEVDNEGKLKGYSRYGAWYGDPYGDWCAMFVSFCLHYAEVEDFPLEANCDRWIAALKEEKYDLYQEADTYIPEPGDLIFFDWDADGVSDHVGLVAEWIVSEEESSPDQVKALEGNSGDRVQYVTYDADDSRIAGYGQLPEQTFYCGIQGHVHTERCYGADGRLLCGLEEHQHTEECELSPEEQFARGKLKALTYTGADYTVRVLYGTEAELPEGVTLEAEEILPDSEDYQLYYDEAVSALAAEEETTVLFARFFDVRFLLDGEKVEPAAPVSVTITYHDVVATEEPVNCQAIHFAEDGPELLAVETRSSEEGSTSFTHTQSGFSVVGDMVIAPAAYNSADVGPDALPVDYYVYIDGAWTCVGSTRRGTLGDYEASDWTLYNRDYVTCAQVASILEKYGYSGSEGEYVLAYQQKQPTKDPNTYRDTTPTVIGGQLVYPLSRNAEHPGYNVYYVPANTGSYGWTVLDELVTNAGGESNGFFTVKVYDASGSMTQEAEIPVRYESEYTVTGLDTNVANWTLVRGDSSEPVTATDGSIPITDITTPIVLMPHKEGTTGPRQIRFKGMIDGEWVDLGTLPYYYQNSDGSAYITSDMAAQFFGQLGFSATTDPMYTIGYSYDDIYKIYYAQNGTYAYKSDGSKVCMDVSGAVFEDERAIQTWSENASFAQVFRIWEAGEAGGYVCHYITPYDHSDFHVNAKGGETTNSTLVWLHSAADEASYWCVWNNGNGTLWRNGNTNGTVTFWNGKAPTSAVIDMPSNNYNNNPQLQLYNNGDANNRNWILEQRYFIKNMGGSTLNSDGTWNIPLTPESNGNLVCYYIPTFDNWANRGWDWDKSDGTTNKMQTEESWSTTYVKSAWSVSVRDDAHMIYSDGELDQMTRIVPYGGEITIRVENGEGVLWGVRGLNGEEVEFEQSQDGNYTVFTISNITQPIEVVANKADPNFTVQYYADLERYQLSDSGTLDIIDTSGKNLPQNTENQSLKYLTLEDIGQNTDQNNGSATPLKRVKTYTELTKLYEDGAFGFETHPGLAYFDKLWEQPNYSLHDVLVLKEGRDPKSTDENDWWWYGVNQSTYNNVTFTNIASESREPRQEGVKQSADGTYCILVQENTVIRLHYTQKSRDYVNGVHFHDYDITSGQNSDGTWRSGVTGINIPDNYVLSRNGQRKLNAGNNNTFYSVADNGKISDVFAFGNQNCETGLGLAKWGGNTLNSYNYNNKTYRGCTFGLVKRLDGSDLIWDEWITHANLFDEGTASGKHTYTGGSLTFAQKGDTYTLTAANSTVGSRDNLQYFFNPSPTSGTTHTHIYTNNYWPMDSAWDKTDPLMGRVNSSGTQCDIRVNGFQEADDCIGANHDGVNLPCSDDGKAHNWFFGMNFSLSFNLTADYLGPLEYIFFGDDDMWVFLDGMLICDIGGVHSAVGEYVNLRDYLPNGSSGTHTLSFFYTERGASGSTCWMSFTLPTVTSAATGRDLGSLKVTKNVAGAEDEGIYADREFEFAVTLLQSQGGAALPGTYSATITTEGSKETEYRQVSNGSTLELKAGQTAHIQGIPAGAWYEVREKDPAGFAVTVNGNSGYILSGTVSSGEIATGEFVNTVLGYELPDSGGPGTYWYTCSGAVLILAAGLLYRHKKRRKEACFPRSP